MDDQQTMMLVAALAGLAAVFGPSPPKKQKTDPREEPRGQRVQYNHARALACIREDYLEPNLPLAKLKMFSLQFIVAVVEYRVRLIRMKSK